jgi:hypothetical protein
MRKVDEYNRRITLRLAWCALAIAAGIIILNIIFLKRIDNIKNGGINEVKVQTQKQSRR